jgi:hypothetical protein
MKIKILRNTVPTLFLFILFSSCLGILNRGHRSSEFLLLGSDLNKVDASGGVVQASPGLEVTPTATINTGGGMGEIFVIPEDKSLLRFKLQDDPLPPPTNNGYVHLVVEFDDIESFFHGSENKKFSVPPTEAKFTVTKMEAIKYGAKGKSPKDQEIISAIPTGRNSSTFTIRQNRHYIAILRNFSLPAGDYDELRVTLNKEGTILIAQTIYKSVLNKDSIELKDGFKVTAGRITTIHTVPSKEYKGQGKSPRGQSKKTSEPFTVIENPSIVYKQDLNTKFPVEMNLKTISTNEYAPIEKVFVQMKAIYAVDTANTRILLNDKLTNFELLDLRDGAVALMGHNMVPQGLYAYFELVLGTKQEIFLEGQTEPLIIEDESQTVLRFMGPFDLRGGRLTEIFLDFDPNASIFLTPDRGYILDPTVMTITVISMTPMQDLRLRDALGQRSNIVVSESEIIFQGLVNQVKPLTAQNVYGKTMIYSDNTLQVEDRLRGAINTELPYTVRVAGGTVNGLKLKVTQMPEFLQGERCLLFLKKVGNRYVPVRGEWGKVNL